MKKEINFPTIEEVQAWAKENAKTEPTGAEEFGRFWGVIWMKNIIEEQMKCVDSEICDKCSGDGWVYHSNGGQGGITMDCDKCSGDGSIKK